MPAKAAARYCSSVRAEALMMARKGPTRPSAFPFAVEGSDELLDGRVFDEEVAYRLATRDPPDQFGGRGAVRLEAELHTVAVDGEHLRLGVFHLTGGVVLDIDDEAALRRRDGADRRRSPG